MYDLLHPVYELYRSLFGDLPAGLRPYFEPLLFLLIALLLGVVIRRTVVARIDHLARQTANTYDDVIVGILRRKTVLWVVLIAVILVLPTLPWKASVRHLAEQIAMGIFVLSITLAAVRGFSEGVASYAEKTGTGVGGSTLIRYVGAIILWIVGIMVVLSLFDVSVLPAITALGVGGLAVALAFQDTLANLFAGIYISLSGQIRIGDYITLPDNVDGFVADISWRTTSLRTLSNNLVIVPNKKLSESIITNYSLPAPQMSVELVVGVGYEHDPAWVEQILLDELVRARQEVPGILPEEEAAVRFRAFGDSALMMHIYVQVESVTVRWVVHHELMKRVYRRFAEEGIDIPFPIRTVYLKRDAALGGESS